MALFWVLVLICIPSKLTAFVHSTPGVSRLHAITAFFSQRSSYLNPIIGRVSHPTNHARIHFLSSLFNSAYDSSPSSDISDRVYIRGLPWRASEEEVRDFFNSCGEIVSMELPLEKNGRSTGTALITFKETSAATAAMEHNGADFGGRWLKIIYSNSKPANSSRERVREPSTKEEGCVTVYVGNLSFNIDEDTIRETFKDCGKIANIRFAEDRGTGEFKGFGHVEFVESESTDKAVELAGTIVMDRPLRVDYANEKKRSFGGVGGRLADPWKQSSGGRGGGGRGGRGAGRSRMTGRGTGVRR